MTASISKKPTHSVEKCPPYSTCGVRILTAVRIARRYAHRLPTVQELKDEFGMDRATAYRWLNALRQA